MNTDNYNMAIDRLALYRHMAEIAETERLSQICIDKLAGGTSILCIVYDKDFDEVYRDVREAYDSKYRQ